MSDGAEERMGRPRQARLARRPARSRSGRRASMPAAVLGRGRNEREGRADPTAHAEVLAIAPAADRDGWRLAG